MSTEAMIDIDDFENRVSTALAAVSGITNPEQWLKDALGGYKSASGTRINVATALGYPPLWGPLNKISGHIATMELEQLRQVKGKPRTTRHNAYRVLNRLPCEYLTPFRFREMMQVHAMLYGNGRAWIERNQLGQPIGLYPLPVASTQTAMVDGQKWHTVTLNSYDLATSASDPGRYYKIPDRDVLHIMGLTYTGVTGVPLISVARDVFGLGIAGQDATASQFRNSGRPGLLLESPRGQLRTEKEAAEFLDGFKKAHEGIDAAGRTGLIREGMKAHVLPISAADAQFLEQRGFQREDTQLLFFYELLGDNSSQYKSLPEKATAYINNCLARWMASWTQECEKKLLSVAEFNSDTFRFKFDTSVLMAGDPNSRADYTGKLRAQGLINGDEGREMHGLPPAGLTDDYDNPNVRSGEPTKRSDQSDDGNRTDHEDIANRAIRSRFAALIRFEQRRLNQAAAKDGNFLSWCVNFYQTFGEQLRDACQELGIGIELADEYCNTSKNAILEITGMVDSKGLATAIESLTQDWPESRAEEFIQCLTTT